MSNTKLSQIMKKAHKLAKQMEGDYQARLSLALRQVWREKKGDDKMSNQEMTKEEFYGLNTSMVERLEIVGLKDKLVKWANGEIEFGKLVGEYDFKGNNFVKIHFKKCNETYTIEVWSWDDHYGYDHKGIMLNPEVYKEGFENNPPAFYTPEFKRKQFLNYKLGFKFEL